MKTPFSWTHLLLTIAGVAVTVLTPTVQGVLAGHPKVTSIIAGIWGVIGLFLNKPQMPPAQ